MKEVAMHRYAALLLCCALAVCAGVVAAPAPFPRPSRQSGPWFDGWDKPVDPMGDCRFDRKGDRLTMHVPGRRHTLNVEAGRLSAPRLLRNVEGDFAVQVRLSSIPDVSKGGRRRAGLLVTDGKSFVRLQRSLDRGYVTTEIDKRGSGHHEIHMSGGWPNNWMYLRLERRVDHFLLMCSPDGRKWIQTTDPWSIRWPLSVEMSRKVKVGVLAEAAAEAVEPVFDQFLLSPPPYRSPMGQVDLLLDEGNQ
jgi:hypothetical protein